MATVEIAADFISGLPVRSTPEETESVQVFSKMLVEDYSYPKIHIQTRPQWRVKSRPSDGKKEYPVDIAVFRSNARDETDVYIIVECKKKNRRDGRTQLEDYLRFSRASLGVWFNGDEKLFLRKLENDQGIQFREIPNLPKYGERVEDVGLYKRRDLRRSHNLKSVFRTVRNYLAANAVGITRDEIFAQQIINLIFCKIYDERFTKASDTVRFRAGVGEADEDVRTRIDSLFGHVKSQYKDVISADDKILLDDKSLVYVVGEMQLFCLLESERDAIADAFEVFIGPSLKGAQGQFFTPRNVVKLLVDLARPQLDETVIDPACGSGGFLVEALRECWRQIEDRSKVLGWPETETFSEKQSAAIKNFRGIDKDSFLAKVAKAYMAILGDGRGGVYCENSLDDPANWNAMARLNVQLGTFDVVLTNPPFGKKLKVEDRKLLATYALGHKWKLGPDSGESAQGAQLYDGQAPQILFIERCLELLKDSGRMALILPESVLCNPSHRYVLDFIKSRATIRAVVSFPEELFQPYTHAKAVGVLLQKGTAQSDYSIFMAIAKWCGHDSRGLQIPNDDIPKIKARYDQYVESRSIDYDHLGFTIKESQIVDNIYLPKYYNPEIPQQLALLTKSHQLVAVGDLIDDGTVKISTGHEVGKLAYGTGPVPFVRTSDIANWEIKIDPKQGLSEEIYRGLAKRQDVQPGDILMVRDGTYLVGTCALISTSDTRIVFQSHIFKIRSQDHSVIDPFLLMAVLSSPIVKEQIFAKQFTQDIIDTLGSRIKELVLPIPRSKKLRDKISGAVRDAMEFRLHARALSKQATLQVAPTTLNLIDSEFLTLR